MRSHWAARFRNTRSGGCISRLRENGVLYAQPMGLLGVSSPIQKKCDAEILKRSQQVSHHVGSWSDRLWLSVDCFIAAVRG